MRRVIEVVALAALLLVVAPRAYGADAGAPKPAPVPACVRVATQARWVPYGYNHVVTIENGCSRPAVCRVSTDVAPQVRTAEVAPSQTVEVTTIMASPASQFVASVACTLR